MTISLSRIRPRPARTIASRRFYSTWINPPRASPGVIGHSDERFAFDIDFDACDVGLKTVAKPGDGILFFSQYPSLTLDVHSLHGGCPVEGGTKWVATKWMHTSRFVLPDRKDMKGMG